MLLLLIFCLFVSVVYADIFSGENAAVNWMFLGEEGENLAWVQCVSQGGVYAKDFFCLYGPMLIYPLVWFMKLFGATVVPARVYSQLLDLLAFAIYLLVFNRILRNKAVFVVTSAVFVLMLANSIGLSPNATILRVALGILTIYLIENGVERNKAYYVFVAGIVLGQSLLFSQEVGVCAGLASGAMLMLHAWREPVARKLTGQICLLMLGLILSLLPMLSYFAVKGALGDVLKGLYLYPRLVTLGYGGTPFPAITDFLQSPFQPEVFTPLWIITVYVTAAIALTVLLALRRAGPTSFLATGLLVFGVLLFRAALGRSDGFHYMFVAPPALMLLFICLDNSVTKAGAGQFLSVRILRGVGGGFAGITVLLAFICAPFFKIQMARLIAAPQKISELARLGATKEERYVLDRAGIALDKKSKADFIAIRTFLDSETKPGDYVMFFPNEAAYYFLFNRRNPTRYVISYFAATSEQRREMIADLERHKPEYLLYSLETWRVDDIPEHIQLPELVDYIGRNYETDRSFADVVVMRRKKS
jgi:hypothetical protein